MHRTAITAGAAALLLAACAADGGVMAPTQAARPAATPLAALIADYETFLRRHDPITAGQEGDGEP